MNTELLYPEQALAITLGVMYVVWFLIARAVDALFLLWQHVEQLLSEFDQAVGVPREGGDQ